MIFEARKGDNIMFEDVIIMFEVAIIMFGEENDVRVGEGRRW